MRPLHCMYTYWALNYCLQNVISRSQAGLGRLVKQQQKQISPNHVQRLISGPVLSNNNLQQPRILLSQSLQVAQRRGREVGKRRRGFDVSLPSQPCSRTQNFEAQLAYLFTQLIRVKFVLLRRPQDFRNSRGWKRWHPSGAVTGSKERHCTACNFMLKLSSEFFIFHIMHTIDNYIWR